MIRIYLFWALGLFLLTFAGSGLLPLLPNTGLGAIGPGKDFNYPLSLAQWDGGNYLDIASNGYHDLQNFAFFPLYPLLVKIFSFIAFKSTLLSAILLSNIFFVLFLYKLYHYTAKVLSAKKAASTVLTFLLYPATFFCLVAYSESLFLLLAILSLDAIYDKKFLKSSIFVSIATLTRFIGIGLVATVVFSYFVIYKQKIHLKDILVFPISLLGILSFSLYSYIKSGDPLRFISVQHLWQRGISDPISTTFSYFWSPLTLRLRPINDYLDLALTMIFFVILMYGAKKIPLSLWLFSLFALLIPTYSGTLTSMPRYLLSSLGVFLIIGSFLEERPALKVLVWSLMLALQCLLAALFINGHWVA